MKVLVNLDFNKNQALQMALQNLATHPASPADGQIYWNTTDKTCYIYDLTNTTWKNIGGDLTDIQATAPLQVSIDVNGVATLTIDAASALTRGTMSIADKNKLDAATNSNTASTIVMRDAAGNFAAGEINATKVTGLSAPTAGSDAVNKTYVDGLIDNSLKTPEAFAPSGSYPTTYAGNAIQKGDTFRITAAGTMGARTVNNEDLLIALVDTPAQVDGNWTVSESNRDQATETVKGVVEIATQTETDTGTDDGTVVTPLKLATWFTNKNGVRKATFTAVPIGTTPGIQTLTHNFGTRSLNVTVMDESTYEEYIVDVVHTSLNAITVNALGTTKNVTVTIEA